jgi:hypothetical protein
MFKLLRLNKENKNLEYPEIIIINAVIQKQKNNLTFKPI